MKSKLRFALLVSLSLALLGAIRAADIDGTWRAEFESQVGPQKLVLELKADGEKLTGTASADRGTQFGKTGTEIKNGKITKDEVSFTEEVKIQGREIVIEYKGKLVGDELKLHRSFGAAGYDIVAKRVKKPAK
ncbi:MAG: hypothetical protein EXS37_13560 [Opitutus sp.]|nr:hypothetical protein [Opitutus sp.]